MLSETTLFFDLTLIFLVALIFGYLASKLNQQVMIAYLFAGILIGPYGLKIISSSQTISTLSEIGVALLLFTVGVELSLKELDKIKKISIWGTTLQILIIIGITFLVGYLLGLKWLTSIYLGCIIAISSTVIVMKALMQRGETNTLPGRISLGMLIIQDLAVILIIAILPTISTNFQKPFLSLFFPVGKAVLLLVATYLLARRVAPFIFVKIAETKSRELFILVNLAICFGMAMLTKSLGLSLELGAFVGGVVVSESRLNYQTLGHIIPLRDIFVILFFTSVGMLINPYLLVKNIPLTLIILSLIVVGKFLVFTLVVLIFKYSSNVSILVGAAMINIGEFSFIIARMGEKQGAISAELYSVILTCAFISIFITPFSIGFAPHLYRIINKVKFLHNLLGLFEHKIEEPSLSTLKDQVIIYGYGRVGGNLGNILEKYEIPFVVIDHDITVIKRLREKGIPAIYGDASNEEVLHQAQPQNAKLMVIALPDITNTQIAIRHTHHHNPNLPILARAHYDYEIEALYSAGAEDVIQPEFEASLETIKHTLIRLGYENIECEINNIRKGRYKLLYEGELDKVRNLPE